MTPREVEKLALALRTIGDGFNQAASALLEGKDAPSSCPADSERVQAEAFIDQRSPLVSKDVYLRLARERAFPSKKVGKLVVAQWAAVRAALVAQKTEPSPPANCGEDDLDHHRRSLGLQPKAGS